MSKDIEKPTLSAWLKRIVAGLFIGMGGITPGVSGGMMAVAMGVYESGINALCNLFKAPKQSLRFLLPIVVGLVAGVLCISNTIGWLMEHWRVPVMFLFIGLVVGSIPSIVKEGNKGNGFRPRYLVATVAGLGILILFAVLENGSVAVSSTAGITPLTALLCGGIIAIGTVVPGISTAFILMYMGLYDGFMAAIGSLDFSVLVFAAVGFVLVVIAILKLVQFLFRRFGGFAYYAVLGFACGSILLIIPPVQVDWSLVAAILMLGVGIAVSLVMEKRFTDKKVA